MASYSIVILLDGQSMHLEKHQTSKSEHQNVNLPYPLPSPPHMSTSIGIGIDGKIQH